MRRPDLLHSACWQAATGVMGRCCCCCQCWQRDCPQQRVHQQSQRQRQQTHCLLPCRLPADWRRLAAPASCGALTPAPPQRSGHSAATVLGQQTPAPPDAPQGTLAAACLCRPRQPPLRPPQLQGWAPGSCREALAARRAAGRVRSAASAAALLELWAHMARAPALRASAEASQECEQPAEQLTCVLYAGNAAVVGCKCTFVIEAAYTPCAALLVREQLHPRGPLPPPLMLCRRCCPRAAGWGCDSGP